MHTDSILSFVTPFVQNPLFCVEKEHSDESHIFTTPFWSIRLEQIGDWSRI